MSRRQIYNYRMDIINLKIKFLIDWLISKKTVIYRLSCDGLPIFRTLNSFVKEYIDTIGDFIYMMERLMEQKRMNNRGEQNIIEALNLIRKKQINSVEEWKEIMKALKQSVQGKINNKKIEQIFQNLDADIEYYNKLRERLMEIIKKNDICKQTSEKTFSQKYWTENRQADKIYYESEKQKRNREIGKIKKVNNQEQVYTPYKLRNQNHHLKYETERQKKIRYNLDYQMKNELKRKHTQVESNIQDFAMNKTPKKYSTPEKTKVKEITPEKKTVQRNKKQQKSAKNIKRTAKKYKYLFETQDYSPPKVQNKKQVSPKKEVDNKTVQKIKSNRYEQIKKKYEQEDKTPEVLSKREDLQKPTQVQKSSISIIEVENFPEDSLDEKLQIDVLGNELKNEFESKPEVKNLEKILTQSLFSSKQWQLSSNDDSLEDIRQTAKFKYFDEKIEEGNQISFGE